MSVICEVSRGLLTLNAETNLVWEANSKQMVHTALFTFQGPVWLDRHVVRRG